MVLKSTAHTFGSLNVHTPCVAPGMRIGIMGGSFNPPHLGHLIVAETAMRRLKLDQVWWVVTPGNPLKDRSGLPSQEARIGLCESMITNPRMKVTGFERELDSPFTAVTTSFLTRRYRGTHFVWLMGADNLATFHRWQDWQGIASAMPIAVVDRPGWRLKALASKAAHALARRRWREGKASRIVGKNRPSWVFLTGRLSGLSSTDLRAEQSK